MRNNFNLIDEKWICTNTGFRSIRECINDDSINIVGNTGMQRICIFYFLQAISIAANHCNNIDEVCDINMGDFRENINNYLDKVHGKFYLYGDNPILQFPKLNQYNENDYFVKFDICRFHAENKGVGNSCFVHDFNNFKNHQYTDEEKANLLIINIGCPISIKAFKGNKSMIPPFNNDINYLESIKNARGKISEYTSTGMFKGEEGYLHSYLMGKNILNSLYVNMVDEEYVNDIDSRLTIGVPPWEYDNLNEWCDYRNTYYSFLLPMNNFMLFDKDDKVFFRFKRGIDYTSKEVYDNPHYFTYISESIIKNKQTNSEDKEITYNIVHQKSGKSKTEKVCFSFGDYAKYQKSNNTNCAWNRSILYSQKIIDNCGLNFDDYGIMLENTVFKFDEKHNNFLLFEENRCIDCNTNMYKMKDRFMDYCTFMNYYEIEKNKKIKNINDFYKRFFDNKNKSKDNTILKNNICEFEKMCNDYAEEMYYKWSVSTDDNESLYNESKGNIQNKLDEFFEKIIDLDLSYNRGLKIKIMNEIFRK